MEPLSREDSTQDEVADFESVRADVAAVVATQGLLVPRGTKGGLTAALLEEQQIGLPRAILTRLVEGKDSPGAVLKLQWEDRLSAVDEEEGRLASRLACRRADGPQHGLQLVEPALAASLKHLLETPCLEALEDLGVGALGLTIASRVRNRGIADLHAEAGAVGLEEAACELGAIVGDDAIGNSKAAHEALDELDGGACRDGAHRLDFCPLG